MCASGRHSACESRLLRDSRVSGNPPMTTGYAITSVKAIGWGLFPDPPRVSSGR